MFHHKWHFTRNSSQNWVISYPNIIYLRSTPPDLTSTSTLFFVASIYKCHSLDSFLGRLYPVFKKLYYFSLWNKIFPFAKEIHFHGVNLYTIPMTSYPFFIRSSKKNSFVHLQIWYPYIKKTYYSISSEKGKYQAGLQGFSTENFFISTILLQEEEKNERSQTDQPWNLKRKWWKEETDFILFAEKHVAMLLFVVSVSLEIPLRSIFSALFFSGKRDMRLYLSSVSFFPLHMKTLFFF